MNSANLTGFADEFVKISKMKRSVKMQPQQERVIKKLEDSGGVLVFHGLGSGKTLTSIGGTEGVRTNVVVPASLRENYKKEVRKFTDSKSPRAIMSYEKATSSRVRDKDALVIDEAQRLGDPTTKRSRAMMGIAKRHKKKLLLSGTPIRNYPHEVAPLVRILNPESAMPLNKREFDEKYVNYKPVSPGFLRRLLGMRIGVEPVAKNLPEFKKELKGRVDYHRQDGSDYPDRKDEIREVEMSPEQVKYYKFVTKKANPMLAAKIRLGLPMSKTESRDLNAFMTAARMVSNTTVPYGGEGVSPKVKAVSEDLQNMMIQNDNHKAVIYSNYLDGGLNEVAKELSASGIGYDMFSGQLNDKQRSETVDRFNSGENNVLLVSGAGAEGLDLKGARSIQVLEPHWNKNRIEQVIGRGIRYKSHEHLPKKDRNVRVVKYHSTLPSTFLQKVFGKEPDTSADQYLHELSEKKDLLIQQFLDVLREEGARE